MVISYSLTLQKYHQVSNSNHHFNSKTISNETKLGAISWELMIENSFLNLLKGRCQSIRQVV